jgi:hypothetical protein
MPNASRRAVALKAKADNPVKKVKNQRKSAKSVDVKLDK